MGLHFAFSLNFYTNTIPDCPILKFVCYSHEKIILLLETHIFRLKLSQNRTYFLHKRRVLKHFCINLNVFYDISKNYEIFLTKRDFFYAVIQLFLFFFLNNPDILDKNCSSVCYKLLRFKIFFVLIWIRNIWFDTPIEYSLFVL